MSSSTTFDLVVLGSGGAGCAAALAGALLGQSVALVEKDDVLGGGTADSLGTFWIASNSLAEAAGLPDDLAGALEYARYVGGGQEVAENLEAYIRQGARVLDALLDAGVGLQLALGLPDYFYPVGPHSCADGRRMVEPKPVRRSELGPYGDRIRASVHNVPGVSWSDSVGWGGFANRRNWPQDALEARVRDGVLACGEALIGQFVKKMLETGRVSILTGQQTEGLLFDGGRVRGVRCPQGKELIARHGVILATGGYEGNPELVQRFEGFPQWINPFGPRNAGDALVFGTGVGASVARIAVNNSLFVGTEVPGRPGAFFSVGLRGLPMPGAIAVNARGERFGDETQFQDMVMALQHYDRKARQFSNLPAFMVFDDQFRARYPLMDRLPDQPIHPDIASGQTLAELAARIGVDAEGLQATVRRFNADVAKGVDSVFGRGKSAFSRNNAGDSELKLNPQLAPVQTAPFYALPLRMGGVCSAGLLTDPSARVLDGRGHAIPGLYACGNAAAPTFLGVGYQGGSSIGAGIVFGYLAAEDAIRSA